MDTDALITVLEAALVKGHSEAKAASEGELPQDIREAIRDHELGEIVLPVLEIQPEFRGKAPMVNSNNGFLGFQSQFVAPILVREARRRESAKDAVNWLQKVLRTEKGAGLVVQTLWGIAPTKKINLTADVDLLPFGDLISSRQKEQILRMDGLHGSRLPIPLFAWNPPTSALVRKIEVCPFLIDAAIKEESRKNENSHIYSYLDEIRLCLAIEGPSIILPGPSWFQYVDPDLEAALLAAGSSFSHQEVLPLQIPQNSVTDLSDSPALVQSYLELEPHIKSRVRIALTRFHQALARRFPADGALELSIALETLMVNDRGEHTYKIALRSALLASEQTEERAKIRAIIEATYGMRSALMHSGHSANTFSVKGQGKRSAEEIVTESAMITARVIKRIIMKGRLPEWNQFEISGGTKWQ